MSSSQSMLVCLILHPGAHFPENSLLLGSEVAFALGSLRERAACGSDGIHIIVLQKGGMCVEGGAYCAHS